jgi:pyruvate dehydrogenase E2 component (dihydrolipoamide acetyltransferase)
MRRVIAAAMARSKREIPHYYLATTIDMRKVLNWLAAENAKRPVTKRLLYSALLIRAVALAAREVPEMNGFWIDGAFRPGVGIHVGVAISLRQGGLVAPALHDVDAKPLDQLMAELLDLTTRARKGVLRGSEVADATITVTNLGDQGVESVLGVIYPPQVALVGFGRIVERPWVCAGVVAARPVMAATLAGDHRASDGRRGGRFLGTIDRLLQEPETL